MEYHQPYLTTLSSTLPSNIESGLLTKKGEDFLVNNEIVTPNRCIHGDTVYVKNGEVVGIKSRSSTFIIGILHLNNNQKYGFTNRKVPYFKFTAISNKYPDFIVPSKSRDKKATYCVIKINKWETKNKIPIGQIEKIIGPVGDLNHEIDMLLYHSQVYPKKNKTKYLKDSSNVPSSSSCHPIAPYNTYSIDPKGCKDIDDAIHYIENKTDGIVEIGIHIANVARYIETLDTSFYSTVYLDNRQINMLDDKITYDICSLGHGEPKRALSLILTYKVDSLELVKHEFRETIVINTALSYQKADSIISSKKLDTHPIKNLHQFTIKLKKLEELPSTKLVEHYMLLYNSLLAETLYKSNPNTILRTHKLSGYQLDESSRVLDPKLQKYLTVINQNAACYISNSGIGHQDLNLDYYTHATSPIRRYVDIINQQNMIRYLNNQEFIPSSNYNLEKVNQFQKSLRKFYNYYKKLKLIFTETETDTYTNTYTNQSIFESNFDAYIIGISGVKLKVFIPELDIEHGFLVISNKLLDSNEVVQESDSITINNTSFKVYDKIKIKITPLKYEEKFNKKLHIKVLEPSFIIN